MTNATIETNDVLTPQQRANKRQNELRKQMDRLPSAYLNKQESKLVETVGQAMGTKRAAIFAGFDLLLKEYQASGLIDEQGVINKDSAAAYADARKKEAKALKPKEKESRDEMDRLPSAYLSDEESKLVNLLGSIAGNKRAALFEGLNLLFKDCQKRGLINKSGEVNMDAVKRLDEVKPLAKPRGRVKKKRAA